MITFLDSIRRSDTCLRRNDLPRNTISKWLDSGMEIHVGLSVLGSQLSIQHIYID